MQKAESNKTDFHLPSSLNMDKCKTKNIIYHSFPHLLDTLSFAETLLYASLDFISESLRLSGDVLPKSLDVMKVNPFLVPLKAYNKGLNMTASITSPFATIRYYKWKITIYMRHRLYSKLL